MSKKVKNGIWIVLCIIVIGLLAWYGYNLYSAKTQKITHPQVTFDIQNYGIVKMELYPEYAPNTVANFIKLVEKGYYQNKVIYGKDNICVYVGRNAEGDAENPKLSLIDDQVEVDSDADYEYTIPGEFVANGFEQNTLRHEKGVVSLIRNDYTQYVQTLAEESYDSGNAQIGIMLSDNARTLNGVYAGFGKIIEGLDIIEKIYNEQAIAPKETSEEEASTETEEGGIEVFAEYPVITSATVDTFGKDYGMPEVKEAFDYNSYMYDLFSKYYSN